MADANRSTVAVAEDVLDLIDSITAKLNVVAAITDCGKNCAASNEVEGYQTRDASLQAMLMHASSLALEAVVQVELLFKLVSKPVAAKVAA